MRVPTNRALITPCKFNYIYNLSHQDSISLLATDMQSTHYNSLDLSFRMDVQMAVLKCLCRIVEDQ